MIDHMNHPQGTGHMTKTLIGIGLAIGMGWTAYFAAPATVLAGVILAQGGVSDFTVRDWSSLGGFAIFAGAMYYLHRQTLEEFRADIKAERDSRDKLAEAVRENTRVTAEGGTASRELIAALRNKAGV